MVPENRSNASRKCPVAATHRFDWVPYCQSTPHARRDVKFAPSLTGRGSDAAPVLHRLDHQRFQLVNVSEPTLHQIQASPPSPVAPSNFIANVPSLCTSRAAGPFSDRPRYQAEQGRCELRQPSCDRRAAAPAAAAQPPPHLAIRRAIARRGAFSPRRPHRRRRRRARAVLSPSRQSSDVTAGAVRSARARGVLPLRVSRRLQPLRHRLPLAHVWAVAAVPVCADRMGASATFAGADAALLDDTRAAS